MENKFVSHSEYQNYLIPNEIYRRECLIQELSERRTFPFSGSEIFNTIRSRAHEQTLVSGEEKNPFEILFRDPA